MVGGGPELDPWACGEFLLTPRRTAWSIGLGVEASYSVELVSAP